ncbi:putative poly-gamma-glutamate synthesis protein [Pseudoalteromonas carrageenovora]|uniref:Putative poly-gamma-glutamate synthesis protein [UI:99417512] n=1 Tax=Pseudoalteromonas carrageenovora IAM 12662 TaxID=1314868 RepID=A0A2K4X5Z3_PSEVC|nr:CapA family protein [Pseudoalteromonas carrageenovora]MBE0381925.1 hypothetical protein [Pseudoalteromonas carrageenovora IAM 12662]QBJ70669.1 putative poly-gamma-glutamate synthesis protein [Pseudoalteromonas carrageenovora]GEB69775.1 hypothetical protein PCA01_04850 [Pseudoalteromonas carrageenovora]SOU39732.1 putative poly-gamma-glutamate synthesis protein [UI:99417512] [Pseudoalteromonas carrageenovora IAM 12662]
MSEIKVLFCGDFAPCRRFEPLVLSKKKQVLGDALPIIEDSDLSFVNLECPLTGSTKAINKSGPTLRADIKCVEALEPFSIIGLANNHILDYGAAGLADTLTSCHDLNLTTVGAGLDKAHTKEIAIKEVKGVRFAVIAIAEHEFNQSECNSAGAASIDLIENYQQIQIAKSQADIVIVTLHGGNEFFCYPRPGLRRVCQHFVDLGVDAVICHHPHVPGAYEFYRDKPIVYSLGNFIFDENNPPADWKFGYMVQLGFDANSKQRVNFELIPYEQSIELKGIKILKGNERELLLSRLEEYRKNLESIERWLIEWESFVAKRRPSVLVKQFLPFSFPGAGFLFRNTPISKFFVNERNGLAKLNLIRCESHLELLTSILKSEGASRDD